MDDLQGETGMDTASLLTRLKAGEIVSLKGDEATRVLESFDLLEEKDTRLSGPIRILRVGEMVVVAERPEPGELVFRRMTDRAAADAFVKERLDTYERMWDGCGCRIDYHH
jgi:hypothetical protein